jgi:hypothetical protein
MGKQEYEHVPVLKKEVRGCSSKTIFSLMTRPVGETPEDFVKRRQGKLLDHPHDVDDWERNRALLLCYPAWRARLSELRCLSLAWERLVQHWDDIEALYDTDYAQYGHMAYKEGQCCAFIRSLVK